MAEAERENASLAETCETADAPATNPDAASPMQDDMADFVLPDRKRAPLTPGLYLVATPIGNLEDMTLRGLRVLREVDRIACEDTRQTAKLLHHFGIRTPLVSYHLHNERGRAEELVERLQAGERIAVVSDAGTPGIADPGEAIVAAAIASGVPVFAVPGANAALGALVSSGLPTERFTFRGFLPSKAGERRTALEAVRAEMLAVSSPGTQVFYETPHRVVDALADVIAVFGGDHRVVLARELTKLHEEMLRGTAGEVHARLLTRDSVRGEMVLLLDGSGTTHRSVGSVADAVRSAMREGLDEGDALKRVARERGMGKSEAYREWQRAKKR